MHLQHNQQDRVSHHENVIQFPICYFPFTAIIGCIAIFIKGVKEVLIW